MGVYKQAYLPAQWDFVGDRTSRILGYVGGYGAGKTEAAVLKALDLGPLNAPLAGMVVEPTFDQIENVFLETLNRVLNSWGVPARHRRYDSKKHDMWIKLNGTKFSIRCRSADRPERLAGHNLGHVIVDEADHVKEAIGAQLKARFQRSRRVPHPQICLVGTPEKPGGWVQHWLELDPAHDPHLASFTRLIRSATSENFFLPDGFVNENLSHLSEQERDQYEKGLWVRFTGRVYTNWDETKHLIPISEPWRGDHFMAADFGFGVQSWLFCRVLGDQVHVFDEQILEQTDTDTAAAQAAQRWAEHFSKWSDKTVTREEAAARVEVYCDPQGGGAMRRSVSDRNVLERHGFTVRAHHRSHPIRDRVNAMQFACKNDNILVDPVARYTHKCLAHQGYDDHGKPKKGTFREGKKGLDHGADALGYLVEYLWPLRNIGSSVTHYH